MTQQEIAVLALEACSTCSGYGVRRFGFEQSLAVCKCVNRAVFRICLRSYREREWCAPCVTSKRAGFTALNHADYRVDFELASRRCLNETERKVFRVYHFEQTQWKEACRRTGLSKGNFFHSVYRIEARMGQELRDTAMFPPSAY